MMATLRTSREQILQLARSLTQEEHLLVVLKRELYDGSWEAMEADLQARLEGRPYVFRLAHRIEDDLERIQALKDCEEELGADLADFLPEDPPRRPRRIR